MGSRQMCLQRESQTWKTMCASFEDTDRGLETLH